MGAAPLWVKVLLGLRQVLVRLVGIRRADPRTVFEVDRVTEGEVLIDTRNS